MTSLKRKIIISSKRDRERKVGTPDWLQMGILFNPNEHLPEPTDRKTAELLFKYLELNTGNKIDDKLRTFQIVLANLFEHRRHRPVSVSYNRNFWVKPENESINNAIIDQLKALHKGGFIEMQKGYNYKKPNIDMRKMWPTEKLLNYFPKHPRIGYQPVELVELRELDSTKQLHYRNTKTSRTVRKILQRANKVNNDAMIWHPIEGEVEVHLIAIFKENFSLYGRLHTSGPESVQGMWEADRQDLIMADETVVELDFSALHPHLIYAEEGIQYFGDPYLAGNLHPVLRPVLKILLMAMLHSTTKKDAAKAVNHFLFKNPTYKDRLADYGMLPRKQWIKKGSQEHWMENWKRSRPMFEEFIYPLMDKFIEAHQPIAKHFFGGKKHGLRIMNRDATIALNVLKHFTEKEIPCIPIHDSFLVPVSFEQELKTIMQQNYQRVTGGFRCPIKRAFEPLERIMFVGFNTQFFTNPETIPNSLLDNGLISNRIN